MAIKNYTKAIKKAEKGVDEAFEIAKNIPFKQRPYPEMTADERGYLVSESYQQSKKVHANRWYQLAICTMKSLRYGKSSTTRDSPENLLVTESDRIDYRQGLKEEWEHVDELLQDSITLYSDIRFKKNSGAWQPIFIDYIIRLIIVRAFVANQLNRPLTALRILDRAEKLLEMIRDGRMEIQVDSEVRVQAFYIPYDILE